MRGNTNLPSTQSVVRKASSVQIISPTSGVTRKLPPDAATVTCTALSIVSSIAGLEEERDQAEDERVEHDCLGQRESQPLNLGDLVAHLRLARDRLDHLAEDVPDSDTRADRAETRPHAQRDRLAGVRAVGLWIYSLSQRHYI